MKRYYDTNNTFSQPTVSELKQKARASSKSAGAKGRQLNPVVIEGREIARSWWGKAWCSNLEQYADYESRLSRGKRYVMAGTVIDLEIKKGRILAKVQGSRRTPYKVEVRISPLSEERCQDIIKKCRRRIDNLEILIKGDFPSDLNEHFTGRGGLFPEPKEIGFACSCPDWALMCKHVAAVLYGVGARLDESPLLFFELRGIDVNRFVDVAIASRVEEMLMLEKVQSTRIIDDDDMVSLFGVLNDLQK